MPLCIFVHKIIKMQFGYSSKVWAKTGGNNNNQMAKTN